MGQTSYLFKKGINVLRFEGPHYLLWRMLKKGLLPIGDLGISCFCRKNLTQPLKKIQAKVDISIGQVFEDEIYQLATLEENSYLLLNLPRRAASQSTIDAIYLRLNQGAKCFVARVGKEIVHYNWIFLHQMPPFMGYSLIMNNHETYFGMGFTAPDWRGKGIHGAVNNHMLFVMQQEGFRIAYTRVRLDNIHSRKGLSRVGWEVFGILLYFVHRNSNQTFSWEIKGPLDPYIKENTGKIKTNG